MFEFWRTWYLLSRLRREALKAKGPIDLGAGQHYYLRKSQFLEQIAAKRFFYFNRAEISKNRRQLEDKQILEKLCASSPNKVEERRADILGFTSDSIPATSLWIRTTGHGDEFAHFSTALVAFLNQYKILWAIFAAVFIFGISFSPTGKEFLANHGYGRDAAQQQTFASSTVGSATIFGTNNGNMAGVNYGTQTATVESAPPLFAYKQYSSSTLQVDKLYHTQFVLDTIYSIGDVRQRPVSPSQLFIECATKPLPCIIHGRGCSIPASDMPSIPNAYTVSSPQLGFVECTSVSKITDNGHLFQLRQI